MNESNNLSIKIIKQTYSRAVCENTRKSIRSQEIARRMYCSARLSMESFGCILCIALDCRGNFSDELVLNSDHREIDTRLINAVKYFCKKSDSAKIMICMSSEFPQDTDTFQYLAAGACLLSDKLNEDGIDLFRCYLSYGNCDIEDITPDNTGA